MEDDAEGAQTKAATRISSKAAASSKQLTDGQDFITIPADALKLQLEYQKGISIKKEDGASPPGVLSGANHTYVLECPGITIGAQQLQMPATPASVSSEPLSDDGLPMSPGSVAVSPTGTQHSGGGKLKSRLKSSLSGGGGKEDRVCGVCGDKALGCNFDAVSCESCKAFFRRNALKDKKTKCLFDGSCKIDVNTRRFCPHCRLQKCFTIGMRKELILGETDKRRRMEKVIQNREKRKGGSSGGYRCRPQVDNSPPEPPNEDEQTFVVEENPVANSPRDQQEPTPEQVIVNSPAAVVAAALMSPNILSPASTASPTTVVMSQPTPTATLATSPKPFVPPSTVSSASPSASSVTAPPLSSAPGTPGLPSSGPSVVDSSNLLSLAKLVAARDQNGEPPQGSTLAQLSPCLTQMDSFLLRKLSDDESRMLTDLMQVYDLSFTVDLEPLIHIKQLDPSLNQLVNQSSVTVLRLIKFAKRLEDFVTLPQECQIGILKGCWIHILLLRSVSLYDCNRDVWVTPRGDIPTEILKNATGFVKLHDDHVNYCNSLKGIIGDDLMIVVVLLVIVIFAPDGPHVVARQLVSNIQDKYLVLLKHYLESKYTYMRASEMYPQLMAKMKELRELAEVHGKHLLDVNPREIEPIMLEILDLK